ncbi:MAG: type II toxin-antitoxin system ParD family antitoxin [Acidobacteria bacterium]|nr:type II toxin-antitoxin system ParD family antitoxin [Acidobacteriota bacterium]
MAKITISMPDAMSEYVTARVESGQYGNVSEYFRDLVRVEQRRKQGEEELRRRLEAAEASGVSDRTAEDIWADAEARYKARNA